MKSYRKRLQFPHQEELKHTRFLLAAGNLGVLSNACCFAAVCRPCFKRGVCDESDEWWVSHSRCVFTTEAAVERACGSKEVKERVGSDSTRSTCHAHAPDTHSQNTHTRLLPPGSNPASWEHQMVKTCHCNSQSQLRWGNAPVRLLCGSTSDQTILMEPAWLESPRYQEDKQYSFYANTRRQLKAEKPSFGLVLHI